MRYQNMKPANPRQEAAAKAQELGLMDFLKGMSAQFGTLEAVSIEQLSGKASCLNTRMVKDAYEVLASYKVETVVIEGKLSKRVVGESEMKEPDKIIPATGYEKANE